MRSSRLSRKSTPPSEHTPRRRSKQARKGRRPVGLRAACVLRRRCQRQLAGRGGGGGGKFSKKRERAKALARAHRPRPSRSVAAEEEEKTVSENRKALRPLSFPDIQTPTGAKIACCLDRRARRKSARARAKALEIGQGRWMLRTPDGACRELHFEIAPSEQRFKPRRRAPSSPPGSLPRTARPVQHERRRGQRIESL